jgi:hypothetical protein
MFEVTMNVGELQGCATGIVPRIACTPTCIHLLYTPQFHELGYVVPHAWHTVIVCAHLSIHELCGAYILFVPCYISPYPRKHIVQSTWPQGPTSASMMIRVKSRPEPTCWTSVEMISSRFMHATPGHVVEASPADDDVSRGCS